MKRKNEPLEKLEGCYTAIITPMKKGNGINNEIDYDKLFMLVDDQIKAGIDGLVVAGTTGQSATLEHAEQMHFIAEVFNYVNGRTRIIPSAGSNCTREAINLSQAIEGEIGPSTLLHVTGYYNNPPPAGQFEHYTTIADRVQGNIILYNVPGRTSNHIERNTAIELARHPKIIGLKAAPGKHDPELKQLKGIIENTNPDYFRVLSGEDDLVAKIIGMGGYGVISASANVAPKMFKQMTDYALSGKYEEAEKLQERLLPLVRQAVFAAKNPIPLAYMFGSGIRLPLCSLEKAGIPPKQVDTVLARYNTTELGVNITKYKKFG